MDADKLFSGKAEVITTPQEEARGPSPFGRMEPGQSGQFVFMGWLEGHKDFPDQPIVHAPRTGRTVALPAHDILCDKLANLKPFTPVLIACTGKPGEGRRGAFRYDVQAYPVIGDKNTLVLLAEVKKLYLESVAVVRGGRRAVTAAEGGTSETKVWW